MLRHRLFVLSVLGAATLLASSSARAQQGESLESETRPSGDNGFRIGAGRLHPYIDLEARYDSNVLYALSTGKRTPDMILHVRPGFTLKVPGRPVDVDLAGDLDWSKFFGASAKSTDVSFLFGAATLGLGVNREGQLALDLTDSFRRSDETSSFALATAVVSDYNDLSIHLPIRPGGGALIFGVGGEWVLESFEPFIDSGGPAPVSKLGYNQIQGSADVRWLFLPKTALVLEGNLFRRVPNDAAFATPISGIRGMAGLAGMVTPHIATTLKGGYGQTLGAADTAHKTWLANAEIEYLLSDFAGVKVGYSHTFQADAGLVFSLYDQHRVYADAKMLLAGRLTLHGQAEWDALEYPLDTGNATTQLVRFNPGFDYELMRWAVVGVSYMFTHRTATNDASAIPSFNYTKHEVWLRATFTY